MPSKFFRVDGADQRTGEETYLVLRAKTRPQAEKLARDQGLLISSIRVASPDDWASNASESLEELEPAAVHEIPTEEDPNMPAQTYADPTGHAEEHHDAAPEHFVEPSHATGMANHQTTPSRSRRSATASAPSAAGVIVLLCTGAALIIGGVLVFVLALWPDNSTLRNELQQLDFRLHALVQTMIGSVLVISGLIVCLIAALCHLLPRRGNS